MAIKIYEKVSFIVIYVDSDQASAYALTKGIIIADTKFEFGVTDQGTLMLADEVLTPGKKNQCHTN